ncbi:unnamed protein product [Polarella glacialis]|uniref:Protein kinase domain-containing protein n=1 Tax=Polarella glacialis TaxID=89957 RepID=A0A813FYM7_POLGL|nr:unnamed protein product [Polarella glacialis]
MKVSTSFDPRVGDLHYVSVGSADGHPGVRTPVQEMIASRGSVSATRTPGSSVLRTTAAGPKTVTPKPLPMPCYRSCLPTPQGSVQVLYDPKGSFCRPDRNQASDVAPARGLPAPVEPAFGANAAAGPLHFPCGVESGCEGMPVSPTGRHVRQDGYGHCRGSPESPPQAQSSGFSVGRVGTFAPGGQELAAAAAAATSSRHSSGASPSNSGSFPGRERKDQASVAPFARERERPAAAMIARGTGFSARDLSYRDQRSGRVSVVPAAGDESIRSTPRPPSATSTNRYADRGHEGPKMRVRSIDAGSRSLSSRVAMSSPSDRVNLQRRSSTARQAPYFEDDYSEYSDRFLQGYEKGDLLGRGACAVVWLAVPAGSQTPVAIKQVAKGNTGKKRADTEAARKEVFFGQYFFKSGGEPNISPAQYPGISHIAKLLDHIETKRDIWLVMEFGGLSLTKSFYEIKGEFNRGERVYRVNHLPLLESMKRDSRVLKILLRQLLLALCLLADHHIVHSDIKPDNILVDRYENGQLRLRFIDLGSAFTFDCPENLSLATPEYMPHEGLEVCAAGRNLLGGTGSSGGSSLVANRQSLGSRLAGGGNASSRRSATAASAMAAADPTQKLHEQSQPWSFDIWSLGSILLEMSLGTPLWLSYKCRVANDNRPNSASTGLFAVPGRDPEKIMQRQDSGWPVRTKASGLWLKGSVWKKVGRNKYHDVQGQEQQE